MAIDPLTGLMSQPPVPDVQLPGVQQFGAAPPVTNATPAPTGLMAQPAPSNAAGYTANQLSVPTKWNVEDNQTVAGNVRNLIAENNPLQQQAATRAKQAMNQNGMLNSTMAVQAGQAAMYDAALPIATADAATYGRSAAYNADSQNQFSGKNLDASNAALNATAGIQANTARDTAQVAAQAATASNLATTNTAAAVLKAQNDIATAAAGAVNDQTLVTLRGSIAKANMGQEQSILSSRDLTTNINQIQTRTDIDGPTKTAYINEAIGRANDNFALIAKASALTGNLLQFNTAPASASPPASQPYYGGDPTVPAV